MSRSMKIAIVDDEQDMRQSISQWLALSGFETETFASAQDALKVIASDYPGVVVTDIKMPGKSGYEVFAAAKEANAETPVILTTGFGYDPNHTIVRARREGLAAVLFKPFKVDQLLSEIRIALGAEAD